MYNRVTGAEPTPLPPCDPGLPPMPPNRGPSSYHGVRVGSLNSFNGYAPGVSRYGSNFSVPGQLPGYPEYRGTGDTEYRGQEDRVYRGQEDRVYRGQDNRVYRGQEDRMYDSQYESASIYQPMHSSSTGTREGNYRT